MVIQQYSQLRELERFPTKYFLSKGQGESDQQDAHFSFSQALRQCGVENYTTVTHSAMLPHHCEETTVIPEFHKGAILETILARCDGKKGDMISAGIMIASIHKKSSGRKEGSLVVKVEERLPLEEAQKKLQASMESLFFSRYDETYELRDSRIELESMEVTKAQGSVVVTMGLTEYEQVFAPARKHLRFFLKEQASWQKAKYVIAPFLYDATATYNKGASEAPLAILNASEYVENYDIETDSQPSKAGIHTIAPRILSQEPASMIEEVREIVSTVLKEGKLPILLGGDPGISIGAFHALKESGEPFTILQLDAHAASRPSFDGTPYSQACVMARGRECTEHVVQVGIRSIANREKGVLDYDKLFFASDIKEGDNLWIDDVIEECTDRVYITLDVDVFDPSIMHSGTPVPDGLLYHHVMKLLKKVVQKRKVVGFDVNNLVPVPGMNGPEFTVAKLIYQFIAHWEKS